ncbi:hypothetical protein P7H62_05310 [Vagococcus carniphilus]|uniref:DUF6602 domain-containing protein n=1 Tax=Vagococcus carniphilus TaxID=218144 RepID=UPI0028902F26|nr:DUF6602 domain-containing protein [Vagococcus carniphilus]MDT2830698.1 hypothetical protein [Vagococcus carniphilus]MDT2839530.1 hypothetical protein [Vagococcus carniphilus]MDT2853861.1 hypothetical protein [Vagococcus carniphilus]
MENELLLNRYKTDVDKLRTIKYKHISDQIRANQDIVSELIGSATHVSESGSYNERVLMKILRKELDGIAEVNTGFVVATGDDFVNTDKIVNDTYTIDPGIFEDLSKISLSDNSDKVFVSTQQDIIVTKIGANHIFVDSDFIITDIDNILAVIEVKTSLRQICKKKETSEDNPQYLDMILKKQKESITNIYNNKKKNSLPFKEGPIFHGVFFLNSNIYESNDEEFEREMYLSPETIREFNDVLNKYGIQNQFICFNNNVHIDSISFDYTNKYGHILFKHFTGKEDENDEIWRKYEDLEDEYLGMRKEYKKFDDEKKKIVIEEIYKSNPEYVAAGIFVNSLKRHCRKQNNILTSRGLDNRLTNIFNSDFLQQKVNPFIVSVKEIEEYNPEYRESVIDIFDNENNSEIYKLMQNKYNPSEFAVAALYILEKFDDEQIEELIEQEIINKDLFYYILESYENK